MLRAKVLYGTKATLKKPKYSDEMDFNRFDKKFGGKFDDIEPIVVIKNEPEFVSTCVNITTLSEILKEGDF